MIRKVFDIMNKEYIMVDALCGVSHMLNIATEKTSISLFPVTDNGEIIGVITKDDLLKAHPNRIAIDVMSGGFEYINVNESIWNAKELLEEKADTLLVTDSGRIVGVVTKKEIDIEISKHIDLLTGLYKKDYIMYNSLKLLEQGNEIIIAFFDVNGFGYMNKKYGHVIGDGILKDIGKILNDNAQEGTYICRYAGDEFALVTKESLENCKGIAQNMVNMVKHHEFYGHMNVGISVGIAGGRRSKPRNKNLYDTVAGLINLASLASTKAKNEKNNLFVGYSGIIDEIAI